MGLISRVKEFVMNILKTYAKKEFNVGPVSSAVMEAAQAVWQQTISGHPYWLGEDKDIRTINFAKFLCQYTAKKTCLDLKVSVSGSERAGYIDRCISNMITKSIRDKVEDACGAGGIIIKPSGTYNPSGAVDYVMPGNFIITEKNSNGDILGIIFIDRIIRGSDYYTRLEYHHFVQVNVPAENDAEERVKAYTIENRAYKSGHRDSLGREVKLADVPEWAKIQPQLTISNIEKPLFGYFKMPYNNTIDYESPEGVALFSNCIEELRDLDIAWSMKGNEVEDSKHMTFVDENRIVQPDPENRGLKVRMKLPRFVKGIRQGVDESTIHEHVATLLTDNRIRDINSILSMISTKAGFSQGQFVLDRKTGMITATQVESDDSETVETINDIRAALKSAIKDLAYALDKYCDVFFDMPSGYVNVLDGDVPDEDVFYFRDLMSTFEQDRMRAYQLMTQGVYSRKKYLTEYEGFDEKEAEKMLAEAAAENNAGQKEPLFDEE